MGRFQRFRIFFTGSNLPEIHTGLPVLLHFCYISLLSLAFSYVIPYFIDRGSDTEWEATY